MDGVEIKALRKQLGFTQEEFAHEVGVTFATVNRWENRKSKPSRLALKILAVLTEKTEAAKKPSRKKTRKPRKRRR